MENRGIGLNGDLMSTQVASALMRELKTGIYADAEKLPAEMELAGQYGVSRTVIRDALSDLENAGFIERVRGVGTVLVRRIVALDNRLDLKLEYSDMIWSMGSRPVVDSIVLREESASETAADRLGVPPGGRLIACRKRVLANRKPVIYSVDYIPQSIFDGIDYMALDWYQPIFDLLSKYCGLNVTNSITHVSATNGDSFIRSMLTPGEGAALLLLEEVSFCKLNRPVLYSLSYYTSFFDFTLLRKKF